MTTQIVRGKLAIRSVLLMTILQVAVQAQYRFSHPSNTDPVRPPPIGGSLLDSKQVEQPQRVHLSMNATTWQESDSLWAAKSMPSSVGQGVTVSGVEWVKQDRGAVYYQPGEYIRVEAKWSSSVPIEGMRINTYTGPYIQLYDDGTHGDKVAGDGIWTLDSVSIYSLFISSPPYKWYRDSKYGSAVSLVFLLEWQLSDGTWDSDGFAFIGVGMVDPLSTFDVQKLGPGLWATEYALFIEDSLQSQRIFPGYPATGNTWASDLKPASTIFYGYFPDAFDFLLVTPATPVWLPGTFCIERVPNQIGVKNDVEGIGLSKFDSTRAWGSQGKLLSVVYHSNGPFDILDHELGHTWMAYIDTLTVNNGGCGVHWAENQTIGGPMSLWPKVVESAPGVFKGETQNLPGDLDGLFSSLDLYLMGLKPLSEVPLIKRLNDPDYTNIDTVRYSSVSVFDPQTLPARYGERRPAYPNAQHDFKMATIVVKPLGWTDAEFAYFSILAKYTADTLDDGFGCNYDFEKATKGLASLESKMFTPSGAPSVPVLDSPADGATGQPTSVTFKWDSSQGASSFHLQVSMKDDFTDTLIEESGIAGTSYALSGLTKDTTYYWRVRALGSTGISRFSDPRSFTTSPATSVEQLGSQIPNDFALSQNYPDPFNPSTTISYQLPVNSFVTLKVYDVLGREVKTLVDERQKAGEHSVTFDASRFPSGVYFDKLTAVPPEGTPLRGRKFSSVKKLVVIK